MQNAPDRSFEDLGGARARTSPVPTPRGRPRGASRAAGQSEVQTLNLALPARRQNQKYAGRRPFPHITSSKNLARVIIYPPGISPGDIGLVKSSAIP